MNDRITIQATQLITDNCLILDTETTGLDDIAEIIEIAIIDATAKLLLNRGVKPSRPIPAEVTAIHGITDADVENCPTWATIWPCVRELISNQTVIAYNAPFDRAMIANSCGKYPEQIEGAYLAPVGIGVKWVDLMGMWMDYTDVRHRVSLRNACADAGIQGGWHRAWSDAEAARQLLHYIAGEGRDAR